MALSPLTGRQVSSVCFWQASSDGLVEGCEAPQHRLIAVQWHPEELAPDHPAQQDLFRFLA